MGIVKVFDKGSKLPNLNNPLSPGVTVRMITKAIQRFYIQRALIINCDPNPPPTLFHAFVEYSYAWCMENAGGAADIF